MNILSWSVLLSNILGVVTAHELRIPLYHWPLNKWGHEIGVYIIVYIYIYMCVCVLGYLTSHYDGWVYLAIAHTPVDVNP